MSVSLTSVLLFNDLCLQVMAGLQGTPGRGDWKGCKLDINEEISFTHSKV
jgi:hypothetical protein